MRDILVLSIYVADEESVAMQALSRYIHEVVTGFPGWSHFSSQGDIQTKVRTVYAKI
jgi:hypothetical protein